jgi:hypothetical protein
MSGNAFLSALSFSLSDSVHRSPLFAFRKTAAKSPPAVHCGLQGATMSLRKSTKDCAAASIPRPSVSWGGSNLVSNGGSFLPSG